MSKNLSLKTLEETLAVAGITGLDDEELSRILNGSTDAIHAVDQITNFLNFDDVPAQFYSTLESLAQKEDS